MKTYAKRAISFHRTRPYKWAAK